MSALECIDELYAEFEEQHPVRALTVGEGMQILLMCRKLALRSQAIGEALGELEDFVGAPKP